MLDDRLGREFALAASVAKKLSETFAFGTEFNLMFDRISAVLTVSSYLIKKNDPEILLQFGVAVYMTTLKPIYYKQLDKLLGRKNMIAIVESSDAPSKYFNDAA